MRHPSGSREREQGLAAVPMLVMLPAAAVAITGLLVISLWGLQHYLNIFADIEMAQEMQMVMERLTDDLLQARSVNIYDDGGMQTLQVVSTDSKNGISRRSYGYHLAPDRLHKITYGTDGHPLTAGHALAEVDIVQYACHEREPGLYELTVQGRSQRTAHLYTLRTLIFLPAARRGGNGDAG